MAREQAAREAQERGENQDPWEARRQELAARGDIFDAKGNVTAAGQKTLTESGWSMQQILQIENMQRNQVAPVEVIRPEPAREVEVQASDRDAERRRESLAKAREDAERELQARLKREGDSRNFALGRMQAGTRAYMDAVRNSASEEAADRAKKAAEEAYDRDLARQAATRRPAA